MYFNQYQWLQLFSILTDKALLKAVIGWGATFICAIITEFLLQQSTLSTTCSQFIVIFSAALVMWIFRLVPESVPALFVILSTLFLNINPQHIILSGFVSDSFFQTLSLLGVGSVIVKSRLFYRLSLHLMYYLPPKQLLLQKALFALGALMTPIISVQSARLTLMAPLLDDILISSRIDPQSSAANALACAGFNGCILLSTIFLTGKSSNSVLYSMLSQQNPGQFSWLSWLFAASFPGLLLVGLFNILQLRFFKINKTVTINKFRLKKELRSLPSLSLDECVALLGTATLLIGLLVSSWQPVSGIWICLSVFFVLIFSGAMKYRELTKSINWTFLFYMGAMIGIMRYIQTMGIDLWLGTHLLWTISLAKGNIMLFITCIYLISWLCGLILGTMTAPALLLTVLLPITQKTGMNSWLVAFTILMATEAWIFPYQASYYLCFEELLSKNKNFSLKPLLQFNGLFVLLKLVVLLVSIPFWRWLRIL